jgi:L-2-hydroxyglutarate oxidase LhgO
VNNPLVIDQFDFLVVGAGVVGLSVAFQLKQRYPDASILLLDKEDKIASHASTRNSGVLHAGFYYSPDSLKAKLTVDGNRKLYEFCMSNNIPVQRCGKVVVAQEEEQVKDLENLLARGLANGVDVRLISKAELAQIEPMAKTVKQALWSPNTAVSDPTGVALALEKQARESGVQILLESRVNFIYDNEVRTQKNQKIKFGHLVNAAGLQADKIAKMMGYGTKYSIIPFIGLYYYAPKLKGILRSHIYPTPDPRNPFLGVHFTTTVTNDIKVGPTAIPLLSREQYELFSGFKLSEFTELMGTYPKFLLSKHHDSWSLVRTELPKLSRRFLLSEAKKLSDSIDLSKFNKKGSPGIRAQLFDVYQARLEMDFVIEGDDSSTHLLNAVSPGWTTCLSFGEYVVNNIARRIVQ